MKQCMNLWIVLFLMGFFFFSCGAKQESKQTGVKPLEEKIQTNKALDSRTNDGEEKKYSDAKTREIPKTEESKNKAQDTKELSDLTKTEKGKVDNIISDSKTEDTLKDITIKDTKKKAKKNGGKAIGTATRDTEEDKTDEKNRKTEDGKTTTEVKEEKKSTPTTSGLKAGFADDNKQFSYFIRFLEKFKNEAPHYVIPINERIIFKVLDKDNKPVFDTKVSIYSQQDRQKPICEGKTYADGTFLFFPSEYEGINQFSASFIYQDAIMKLDFGRDAKRKIEVKFSNTKRVEYKNVPLDIVFVLDTTGSMGEEISRLKDTIEIINMNLVKLSTKPKIRFGMVLYKDQEEEYVTKVVPLTVDLAKFQKELDKVEADGGGDEPEDLQSALQDTLKKIEWDKNAVKLAFIITDASTHLDYGQKYTYVNALHDARKEGLKFFSIGTGSLNIMGEYILRQIAQYTYGKFIFLTHGEKGESEGGKQGSVSHHTGSNFQTDKLEAIILRFVKEELSFISDQKIEEGEEFFQAVKISDEKKEETLKKLFEMGVGQLLDYSSFNIPVKTPTSVVPIVVSDKNDISTSEYFTEQLVFTVSNNKTFKLVERKDLQKVLSELELQSSALYDEDKAVKLGNFLGAKILIMGKLYVQKDSYQLFLKLLRVETAEILAVTKFKIDINLGLTKKEESEGKVEK